MFDFDTLPDRRATESVKWLEYGPDVLPMWVADMDFVSPPAVIDALQRRVAHGVFGYPGEALELKEAIVGRMEERYGWRITPEDIILLPGVVTGFNLVCHALGAPGGGALIQTPVYPPFLSAPANAGLIRQEMELTRAADGTYSIDFDAFKAAIDERTRLFILCNPHNPVGRVFQRDELERMAEICLRKNIPICSDEIHSDLIFTGSRHLPIASLSPEIARQTVTLIAPSKTFNIAGLECSAAIITDPELRKKVQHARAGMVGYVNLLGLTAALAAYKEGEAWLNELMRYLEGNRDFLFEYVRDHLPGVQMAKPEGTYLAWLDCRAAGIDGNPQEFFLKKAQVAYNDGATFGKGGEGFIRLNFGCPRSMLEEALERTRKALPAK